MVCILYVYSKKNYVFYMYTICMCTRTIHIEYIKKIVCILCVYTQKICILYVHQKQKYVFYVCTQKKIMYSICVS